jgi:hypothetical protein
MPPKGLVDFWGTIKLDNFIKSSILNVICGGCTIHNNLHFSWHGKVYSQHLEGLPMDDYHEICDAHEVDIEE